MQNIIATGSPSLLSIRDAAWLLDVTDSRVCRAIRVGLLRLLPAVRRRGRVLIPAHTLAHLADPGDIPGEAR